jgi:uncharacterized protein (UPF0216 family)
MIPNKQLRNGSINNNGSNGTYMNEIDYIYHLDIHKIFKYNNQVPKGQNYNNLIFNKDYTIKFTSGKVYPLRKSMIKSLKEMIKDDNFKQFIINLII